MRNISVKDMYYKIEDKWFDFLDAMDTKGVPVYKVIDPIEKAGVPSLPVFIALLLVILYLLAGGINFPSIGGQDVSFTLSVLDSQTGGLLSQGAVAIYSEKETVSSGALEGGKYTFSAKEGTYYANVSSPDCTEVTGQVIDVSEESAEGEISLECVQRLSREVTVCFMPQNIGSAKMKVTDDGKTSDVNCEKTCKATVKSGQTFSFSAENDLISEGKKYTAQDLIDMSENSECVIMIDNPGIEKANTMVIVNDANNTPIGGLEVMLVNPNTTVELAKATTGRVGNNTGKADFSKKLKPGQAFKIKVSGGANTSTYLDGRVFNATKDMQFINVTVQYASPTLIQTLYREKTGGEKSLPGVYIKTTNGAKYESGLTNMNGSLTLGLENNLKYKTTFWKEGYEYQTATVTGGVNNTQITMVKMEKNPDGFYTKAGDLMLYVTFEDKQPVADAEITLYNGTDDTGIPQQKTSYDGEYRFTSMPPGANYYVIIKRSSFQSERIKINEIKAGDETYQEISIKRQVTKIITSVTVNGEAPRDETRPTVYIKDLYKDEANQDIMTKMVDTRGRADFDIPEGTNMNVLVKYTKNNQIYDTTQIIGDIDQYVMENGNTISIDLVPLVMDVSFINITEAPVGRLNPGDVYNYNFRIGTPDNNGKAWDTIEFNLYDAGTVAYEFNEIAGIEDTGYITMEGMQTSAAKITISGDYPRNSAIMFTVPVRIKQVQRDLENKSFKFNATWTAETSVTKGAYETPKFNISTMKCIPTDDGKFTVCVSYENATATTAGIDGPALAYLDNQTMRVEYIYEGTDTFSGTLGFIVDQEYNTVFMGSVNVTKNQGRTMLSQLSSADYDFNATDHINTKAGKENTVLEHGQSIAIKVKVRAADVPRAVFRAQSDSAALKNAKGVDITPNFQITGNVQAKIAAPDEIYDLSDYIEISVTADNYFQKPISFDRWETQMSITGLTCKLDNVVMTDHYENIESSGNTIRIKFNENCKVDRSADNVAVTLSTVADEQIAGAAKTIKIKRCAAPADATKSATAQFQLNCMVRVLNSDSEAGLSVPPAGFCTEETPATYNVKVAEACSGATYAIKSAVLEGMGEEDYFSADKNSFMYRYKLAPANTGTSMQKDVSVTLVGNNSYGAAYEEKPVTVSIILQYEPPADTIEGFKPLNLQKYGQELLCEDKYCTLTQAFMYLDSFSESARYEGAYTVKLARNPATTQNIQTVWAQLTGKETKVIPSSETPATGFNYIRSDAGMASTGTNTFTFSKGTGYAYLESLSNANTEDDDLRQAETAGLQLRMPALNWAISDNAVMLALSTDIINRTNELNSTGSGATALLKKAIASQWNTDESYVDIAGASQKVILSVCNSSNTESEECGLLNTFTGSKTSVPIAIFASSDNVNTAYFIGTSADKLVEAVRRFDETVNEGSASLIMANYTDGNGIMRTYLTRSSNNLRFQCVDNGKNCEAALFDGTFNESLKEIGAKETGYDATEIRLVNDTAAPIVYVAICSDKSKCTIGTKPYAFDSALNEMGITDAANMEVPADGILISKCNNKETALQYMAYATSMDGIKSALSKAQQIDKKNCKMPQIIPAECPVDQTNEGGIPASLIMSDPSVVVHLTFNTTFDDMKGGLTKSMEVGSKGWEWTKVVKGQAAHYDVWCLLGDCGGGINYYSNLSRNYTIGTVSAWALPEYFDEPNLYIAKIIDSNGQELDLLLGDDNELNLFKCRLANASKTIELTKAVASSTEITGGYNQITCSIGKGVMNLYVNGLPVNSTAITGVKDYMNMSTARSSSAMFFNRDITKEGNWDSSTTDSDLRGFIDEVVFLNRSITDSEAQSLYYATGGK